MQEWEHQIHRKIGPVSIRVTIKRGGTPEHERQAEAFVLRCWNEGLLEDLVAETLKKLDPVPGFGVSWSAPIHPKSKMHYRVSVWSNEQIRPAWLDEPHEKWPPGVKVVIGLLVDLAERRLAHEAKLKHDRFQELISSADYDLDDPC